MVTFIAALVILLVGYLVYGAFVEKTFGINPARKTPALTMADGVDYVKMSWKNNSLIQLLNIAGLGPIYGAITGALWGPVAFLWIAFGGIFAGAVHDYFSGMLSIRHKGANMPEMVGHYLGKGMKQFVNVFSLVVLVLVGAVFMVGPAGLLASLTPAAFGKNFWLAVILVYYFLATVLPIDKIIGRIYPIFGGILLIMAAGIGGRLLMGGYHIPELTLANLHPRNLPIWPLMFVTIACGAISGFHATQSPLVARCTENEKHGRPIFYGMMIAESVIALIWAAAAMSFYPNLNALADVVYSPAGAAAAVREISMTMLGAFGGTLAILGVIVLPITSGDTAFRGARLTIAEMINLPQKAPLNRYKIAIPLFVIGFALTQMNFSILWRYFAWSNQTLAMIMLWTSAVYLVQRKRFHWLATIPATFMSAVSFTYILQAPEGFELPISISYPIGAAIAVGLLAFFLVRSRTSTTPADVDNLEETAAN